MVTHSQDKLRVFISYAREDGKALALRLRDDLTSLGYSIWVDLREIGAGAVWSQDIEEAIESCHIMLALMSHGSFTSEYCRAEQLRAARKGKRIVPLLVQSDADRPLHLEHLNYLDFADEFLYDEKLRDLVSDLNAGQAFRAPRPASASTVVDAFKQRHATRRTTGEKRDASAFRRHIQTLQRSPWLGSRYWWPYFLFRYVDISSMTAILEDGALKSTARRGGKNTSRWDDTVRLYFRPRVPDLWSMEGIRSRDQRRAANWSVPVCLLFDLEAVLCQQQVAFSAGDPATVHKTFTSASAFAEMPFELIYHDSFVRSDERDEVMTSRRAQALIPRELGLEALQFIWCRSDAEYTLLRSLLPASLWQAWRDKITVRADYMLFNRRWTYIEDVALNAERAVMRFHAAVAEEDRVFQLRVEREEMSGGVWRWQQSDFKVDEPLELAFSNVSVTEAYSLKVWLDDVLAYQGHFDPNDSGVL